LGSCSTYPNILRYLVRGLFNTFNDIMVFCLFFLFYFYNIEYYSILYIMIISQKLTI
jgi:hypothetical protein